MQVQVAPQTTAANMETLTKSFSQGVTSINEAVAKIGPALAEQLKQISIIAAQPAGDKSVQGAAEKTQGVLNSTASALHGVGNAAQAAVEKLQQAQAGLHASWPTGNTTPWIATPNVPSPNVVVPPTFTPQKIDVQSEVQKYLGGWYPGTPQNVSLPILGGTAQINPSSNVTHRDSHAGTHGQSRAHSDGGRTESG